MVAVRKTTPPPPVCLSVSSLCVSPPSILRRKRVGSVRTPLGDREVLCQQVDKDRKESGWSEVILWWLQAPWGCSPSKACLRMSSPPPLLGLEDLSSCNFALKILPFLKYQMLPDQRFLILKSIPKKERNPCFFKDYNVDASFFLFSFLPVLLFQKST